MYVPFKEMVSFWKKLNIVIQLLITKYKKLWKCKYTRNYKDSRHAFN